MQTNLIFDFNLRYDSIYQSLRLPKSNEFNMSYLYSKKPERIHEYCQYFTTSEILQQFVFDHVKNKNERLLEPSFGKGHLLKKFLEYDEDYPITCYEFDSTLERDVDLCIPGQRFKYLDFLAENQITIRDRYATIVGCPPHEAHPTSEHYSREIPLYSKFIEKCFNLLYEDNGEMIFIVPTNFVNSDDSFRLIERMVKEGSFTDFLFPEDDTIYDDSDLDVVVFRYQRGLHDVEIVKVNGEDKQIRIREGSINFYDIEYKDGREPILVTSVDDLFDVYSGMLSGCDEIFQTDIGNIDLLMDKDTTCKFLYCDDGLPDEGPMRDHLLKYGVSEQLKSRRVKSPSGKMMTFDKSNWYRWALERNVDKMKSCVGKSCIYIRRNITDAKNTAFVGTVGYFHYNLICLIPSRQLWDDQLVAFVNYLNTSPDVLEQIKTIPKSSSASSSATSSDEPKSKIHRVDTRRLGLMFIPHSVILRTI